jgi:PAS domain S-box-containing protein
MRSVSSTWQRFAKGTLGRYSISLAATAVALFLRGLLDPLLGNYTPFITLYPTIVLLAIYLGVGPSALSVVSGIIGTTYWFVHLRGSFPVNGIGAHVVGSLSFLVVSACIIAAGEASRRTQRRLRRTKALFETFLENSPGIEFAKDEAGRYVYVNRIGRTEFPPDCIGKTDFELFPASFASQWRANDFVVLEQNKGMEFIETTPGRDGERSWLSVKFPVIDADGRRLLVGKAINITEMKRAEEKIAASSAQLRRFLETAACGLTRCSRDLDYLSANSAYAAIAGLPLDQIVGRPIFDVIGVEGWETIRPYVEQVLRGERVEFETVLPFAAAGPRHLHVAYMPEKEGQEVVGWVASVTDITEFKRVEKQLREVEKMAVAGQLATSLAHEINNPLSAVMNVLYLLTGRSDLDPEAASLISTANNQIERVARIVKQSLSYYRVGIVAREVDLSTLMEESLQVFNDKFQRACIAISKKIMPGTSIIGFADEIRQVVDNLLVNSVEATSRGGRLALHLRSSRCWKNRSQLGARLTIADNGCGIPNAYLAKVFEPFFTTKGEKGNGLGLWVVKGIVEKHGGSIKIRSTDAAGRSGTVVSIFWPAAVKETPTSKLEQSKYAA